MAFLNVLKNLCPTIEVTFDYTNDPTSATTTWTDITPYVVSYSRQPVRQNEFDQPAPATGRLVLRNDDGRFTPDNATGPYAGGLKKYRRVRVRAQWAGVTYNRFQGYIVDWPQTWAEAGKNATVTLELVDGLTPLVTFDLGGRSFASKASGAAISDVLAAAGITATSLDTGISTIVSSGTLTSPSYALQRIRDISASENGVTFADGGGTVEFHDRHHRLTGVPSSTVQATIGDAAGEVRYYDSVQPQYGDVWPIVNVTPSGGSVQSATVAAGTASYFQQTLNFPPSGNYLVSSAAEALEAAQYISNRYSNPITRVPNVVLDGVRDTSQWPTILNLDTSDRVVFKRRFLVNGVVGGTISLNSFVEGYGDDVTVGQDWKVTVPLSPADPQSYWLLGDSTYSILEVSTRLGY